MCSSMHLSEHPSSDAIWRSKVAVPEWSFPDSNPSKLKGSTGLCQMKGRSSISWRFLAVKAPNQKQTQVRHLIIHTWRVKAARPVEVRTADVCQDTARSPERLVNSNMIIRPFKGAFLASASQHFWKEVHFVNRNQFVHTFFRFNCPFSS